ncbi:MAG: DASS family sodium-coupled anion symporter [Akkermansiaceae bacterium]
MAIDTRAKSYRLLGTFDRAASRSFLKSLICAAVSISVTFFPPRLGWELYEGLSGAGITTLGILIFAALMWITEAIPSFAVALLVIGLEVALLGKPGGIYAEAGDTKAWQMFVQPWASSIMWLFLGGFVLAHACSKTGLDRWLAGLLIGSNEKKPAVLLLGIMSVTFVFSMFMSNTATATMMLAVLAPVVGSLREGSKLAKALCLAVPVAANIGGMGTIIGTPPNAIAAGQLGDQVNFLKWMYFALPPALVIGTIAYGFLLLTLRGSQVEKIKLEDNSHEEMTGRSLLHRIIVMMIFTVTVVLWMTSSFHKTPSAVISFLPIVLLAVTGVITAKDMRELPWDVLILLAGGLSLGVAINATGLAAWFAAQIPPSWTGFPLIIAFAALAVVLSNLMSNTATANIMMPIGIALVGTENATLFALPIALACSSAMCLPISTPPNAVAFASGRVKTRDFMGIGLLMAVVGPTVAILWTKIFLG